MKGVKVEKIELVYSDARGSIADILNEKLGHVGLIVTTKGSVRGNHYHNQSTQYSYILSGKFKVLVADSKDIKKVEKIILNAGELITIEPKITHSFEALEDNTVMIDMISQSRAGTGYENDVIRVMIKED
jgi:dTDP-4-dehydrorhamnose 3,5-epimerase-like enzyme